MDFKEIQPVHPEGDQSWVFTGRTNAETETPILWPRHEKSWLIGKKKPWCWEGLGAGGEGENRGWDGWMASPTQWTWVWVNSNWWWTERPGVWWFMGLQSVGHDRVTELNWTCYFMRHRKRENMKDRGDRVFNTHLELLKRNLLNR